MSKITIADVRAKFPDYNDMSDAELADKLHGRFYADVPKDQFYSQIGLAPATETPMQRTAPELGATPGGVAAPNPVKDLHAYSPQLIVDAIGGPVVQRPPRAEPLPQVAQSAAVAAPGSALAPASAPRPQASPLAAIAAALAPPEAPAPQEPAGLLVRRGQQFMSGLAQAVAGIPQSVALPQAQAMEAVRQQQLANITKQTERLNALTAEYQAKPSEALGAEIERMRGVIDAGITEAGQERKISETPGYHAGQDVTKLIQGVLGTPDPADKSIWGGLASGAGNVVGMIGASAPTMGIGGFASGVGMNAAQVYDEAKAAGADEKTAQTATKWASAIGSTEMFPITDALKLLPQPIRSKITNAVIRKLTHIFASAGEEGLQEAVSQIANNLVASNLYDTTRGWTEGVTQSAVIGGILGGAVGGVGAMRGDSPAAIPENQPVVSATVPATDAAPATLEPKADTLVQSPAPAALPPEAPAPAAAPTVESPSAPAPTEPPGPVPTVSQAQPGPSSDGRYEVIPEVETVDGESVPTGRMIRMDYQTGKAEVVGAPTEPTEPPAPVPAPPPTAVAAPAPEVASAPEDQRTAEPEITVLSGKDLASIGTDAKTFQYKAGGDAAGVTDRLAGIKKWDSSRAGLSIVYEYADGRRVIVDGHQRLGLAKRLEADGQNVRLPAMILRQIDGVSPEDARAQAALKNIAEGSGTAIDAAKVLRDRPEASSDLNLPPNSALVRDADGLRRLSPDAFGMVINDAATIRDGAIVGRLVKNTAAHSDLLKLLARLKPSSTFQAEQIVQQAAQDVTTETQTSLFGDENVTKSLYLERAKILDASVKRLARDMATFRTLVQRGETITSQGNTLDQNANKAKIDDDAQARAYLLSQANRKGPISEALTRAAEALNSGTKPAAATDQFVSDVRRAVQMERGTGGQDGASGQDAQHAGGERPAEGAAAPEKVAPPATSAPAPQAAPETKPQTEKTPAGNQTLIPGVAPVTDKARAEAAMAKPKAGGNAPMPGGRGGLFGDPMDRGDLFDAPPAPKKAEASRKPAPASGPGTLADPTGPSQTIPNFTDDRNGFTPLDPADLGGSAAAYVLEKGRASGVEHMVVLDGDGRVLAVGHGTKDRLAIPQAVQSAPKGVSLIVHHNHPRNAGLSPADMTASFVYPNMTVYAHGHDGATYAAKPTDLGRAVLGDGAAAIKTGIARIDRSFTTLLKAAIAAITARGGVGVANAEAAQFEKVHFHVLSMAMRDAGMIHYEADGIEVYAMDPEVTRAVQAFTANLKTAADRIQKNDDVGRSKPLRTLGDMAGFFDGNRKPAEQVGAEPAPGGSGTDSAGSRTGPAADRGDQSGLTTGDQAFDSALDAIYGKGDAPAAAPKGPTPTRAPSKPGAKPKVVRSKAAIAADINKALGLEEASSPFDDAKYATISRLFSESLVQDTSAEAFMAMSREAAFMRLIRPLAGAGLDRRAVVLLKPYFDRFIDDLSKGKISLNPESDNAPATSDSLEHDSGNAAPSDGLGQDAVPDAAGPDGRGAGRRGKKSGGKSGKRKAGSSIPVGGAPAVGGQGDPGVQGDGRPPVGRPDAAGDDAGGSNRREPGLRPDDQGAAATEREAVDAPGDLTQKPARAARTFKPGDHASIAASVPALQPEQVDDVARIETRFAKSDGHGMLITNGTGTGKTFTTLGTVKRFADQGKGNVLIIVKTDGEIRNYLDSAPVSGVDLTRLEDTKDAGSGAVITTYANMASNNALAGREWDMIVADESHMLSMNKTGDETGALKALRAISNKPSHAMSKAHMVLADEIKAAEIANSKTKAKAATDAVYKKARALADSYKTAPRSKVLFLSATPFAYDQNIDYGEGYLFDYPEAATKNGSRQDGRTWWFVENLGYRVRYHKLTKPEAAVDSGVFERMVHEKLRASGALWGRALDVKADYDRRFVAVENELGQKIDDALKYISDKLSEARKAHNDKRSSLQDSSKELGLVRDWEAIQKAATSQFGYLQRQQLLEAMKAQAAIPDIKKHLAMGRKVVVFHDFNVGGGSSPFVDLAQNGDQKNLVSQMNRDLPWLKSLDFGSLLAPKDQIMAEFGNRAREYNGTVSKKVRSEAKDAFNKDGSGVDVIVVQSDAGSGGISLHDTTGGHQRVLINLGMPTKPTTTLQAEGRTRRVGSVSDAPYRYYTIGTTWERQAFADRIAGQAGTVENLALGNGARSLKNSFIDAYNDAGSYPPSPEDGKGGREKDSRVASISDFDAAKTHYFGRSKIKGRRDHREGFDFYPTPEPLAFKMVEWAGVRPYEKVLEPSAGDGSIARYFPEFADRTIVEPSQDLSSRAALLATGSRVVNSNFEDFPLVNKYDAIVMNPPFGSGGKTAIEHLEKAAKHLRPGGRIVALIPRGPMADKRLAAWFEGQTVSGMHLTASINLPAVTFERAGTALSAQILVMDKPDEGQMIGGTARGDLTATHTIEHFFDRIEGMDAPIRPDAVGPTGVEADMEAADVAPALVRSPKKNVPVTAPLGSVAKFKISDTRHAIKKIDLFVATIDGKVSREVYDQVNAVAKSHGGYWSSFAKNGAVPGFQFASDANRQAFLDDMAKPTMPETGLEEAEAPVFSVVRDALPALRAELDRMNLTQVDIGLDASGSPRQGAMIAKGGDVSIVIGHALDPKATLYHEVIHSLKAMNLFSKGEWAALERAAAKGWVEKHNIPQRYPDLLPSEQIEEAIAEEFAASFAARKAPSGSLIVRAFNKIVRLLKAVRAAFNGQSAEDVFGKAWTGEIGARTAANSGINATMAQASSGDVTKTPAFKRWFGDSKVVDKSGNPLVVYHGTPDARGSLDGSFKSLAERYGEKTNGKNVFFFTDSQSVAKSYADPKRAFDYQNSEPAVGRLYLSIRNPKIIDGGGDRWAGPSGQESQVEAARAAGHDGLIIKNTRDDYNIKNKTVSTVYIVFDAMQIKSAETGPVRSLYDGNVIPGTGPNNGNFDPSSPLIREARQPLRAQTNQQRANQATVMGWPAHIPDRRIWEELTATNTAMWDRIKGAGSAAHDAVDKARIIIQDRFLPVLRAQEAVMKATGRPLSPDENAYAAEETFSGKVGRHLFVIDQEFTKPIIDLIGATNGGLTVESVGEWLTARHAIERNAYIASINPAMPDGGSGMMDADAHAIMAAMAASPHAQAALDVGTLIDNLRADTLTMRLDAGLLSQQEYDLWTKQYQFYVPLKGFAETDHSEAYLDMTGMGRRFNTRGAESKRAMGRRSEAFNPLQAAITQAQEVAIRAEKNRVGQALLRLVENNPAKAMWEVKTPKQTRVFNRTTGMVETRVEDPVSIFMNPNEMAVKVDGKEKRILFNDSRLARAAGSVGADQMGAIVRGMSMFSRYFSAVNTMLNPVFLVTNAFRDMVTAQINIQGFGGDERGPIGRAMIKNWPQAFAAALRGQSSSDPSGQWGQWYKEYEESGGKVAFWKLETPEAGLNDMQKRINDQFGSFIQRKFKYLRMSTSTNPILSGIERVNLAVDNAIRLAAFAEARKRGWSPQKAASLSKNLTVNFNRRGEIGPTINAFYPFANAAIQGTQVMISAMSHKRVLYTLAGITGLAILNGFVNAMLSDKDEDGELAYDKIPDWKQQMNFVADWSPLAGDGANTVPLPYGYNVFIYGGTQISKVARGVKTVPEAMSGMFKALAGAFSPISGDSVQATLSPTLLDPINEMFANEDWLGRPIRPESPYSDFGPKAYKFYGGASEASKFVAQGMNSLTGGDVATSGLIDVSPEYLDYMTGFLLGGAGRFAGQSLDIMTKGLTGRWDEIEPRKIPGYSRVVTDTGSWLDVDRFYKFRDAVSEAKVAVKGYQANKMPVPPSVLRTAGLSDAYKSADKEMKKFRIARKGIEESSKTAAEKRALRENLDKQEAAVVLRANRAYISANGPQAE